MDRAKNSWMGNIYTVLALRLGAVYIMYTVTRLLFYLFNLKLFADVSMDGLVRMLMGGLRFDTSAIIYTNLPVILLHVLPFRFRYAGWYQRMTAVLFYVVNLLALTVNMADSVYYRFTLRRTTTSVFTEFRNEQNGVGLFFRFMWDYWYVTLSVVLLGVGLVWMYRRIRVGAEGDSPAKWYRYYPINLALSAVVVILCIGGMRGGFAHSVRPITLSNASAYVDKPEHREIVLNTPFTLLRTVGKSALQKKSYFTAEELDSYFDPHYQATKDSASHFGLLKGRNVVVILLESFGRELVGTFNRNLPGYTGGYTPFLDSLAADAYLFERAFANGRKSIDAMPSALTSIPAMETPFILSHYSGNRVNSPASLLRGEYATAFFHGAPNGSMGFDAFTHQAGYEHYFGKDEYNHDADFDGMWGIWDEPFLGYMADRLNELPQPFASAVFTLSSHHPFRVPQGYEGRFPKGTHPLHPCIGYTDNALRNFFAKAKQMSWFDNTLFIITADHGTAGDSDPFNTAWGAFAIPMMVYAPGSGLRGYNDSTVVSQSDILPTVMSLLGYDKPFVSYGHNMFAPAEKHFAVNYFNGAFQLTEGGYLLQFENEKPISLYHYPTDLLLRNNLLGTLPTIEQAMTNQLKAIIQHYNNGMLENRLAP